MHHVGVISGVFSFCYVMMGRKMFIIFVYHNSNQMAIPKAPTVPTSKANKGKGKKPVPEVSQTHTLDQRLHSNNSPESILDLSLLSEAPPSPGAMPDSTEVVGSTTLNTGVHWSEVPVMSLPQSGSNTATALTSPNNVNTANVRGRPVFCSKNISEFFQL